MRFSRVVAFLLLAMRFVVPLAPAFSAQTDLRLFEVHGKVVNALTGEPIGGALLQIPGQTARFSDSDGNFAFAGLSRGRLIVTARKPGFFNEQEVVSGVRSTAVIETPSDAPVVVRLTPEAIIFGEVKNAEGEPVEGVEVRAERRQMRDGRRQLQVVRNSVTDDAGTFRLAELEPGAYYLAFSLERNGGPLPRKSKQEQGYGLQFYPGVADAGVASAFNVRAGAQVHVTHILARQPVFQVSGTVRGVSSHGFFALRLVNSAGESAQRNIRVDRQSGEFRISGVPVSISQSSWAVDSAK